MILIISSNEPRSMMAIGLMDYLDTKYKLWSGKKKKKSHAILG